MSSMMRLRRLQADYEAIRRLVRLHPRIDVEGVQGNPPDKYRLVLLVESLAESGDSLVSAREHRLEITLPLGYPRDAPAFRMLTPVFHPNIAPHAVCIADHWSAGSSLEGTIQRVGEMLAYQSYNIKSPLNGKAAQWAVEHAHRLPTDAAEFFVDLEEAERSSSAMAAFRCENCGATEDIQQCAQAQHMICGDCAPFCPSCGQRLCLRCNHGECAKCLKPCANCGNTAIQSRCHAGHLLCGDCLVLCRACGAPACLRCGACAAGHAM